MVKKNDEIIFGEFPPRIEPGDYDAVCYEANYARCWGGRKSLYLRFRIIEHSQYEGIELFMVCNINQNKLSYRTKLFKQFKVATGRFPLKGERFNKNIFTKKLYSVSVIDTKRMDDKNKLLPTDEQYSIVITIIEPLVGIPING